MPNYEDDHTDHHRLAGDSGDRLVLPENPALAPQGQEVRGVSGGNRRISPRLGVRYG